MRRRKMLSGSALSIFGNGFAVTYCSVTWSGPNRSAMLVGYLFGMATGLGGVWAARRGPENLLGYRPSLAMLASTIFVTALNAYWDGGGSSPLTLGFLGPVLFVASSTARLGPMVGLEVTIIGAYFAVVAAGRPVQPGFVLLLFGTMLCVIWVCASQACALARQRSQLRSLAVMDPLTGALNRRGLSALAGQPAATGTAGPSVLYLDLDNFKAVNDCLGHAAGDELLRWVVSTTRGMVRSTDVIARTGGDEFVVILADLNPASASAFADRIGRALRERTGVSIGWAYAPHDGDSLDALLRVADRRLYERKQERRRVSGPRF